MKKIYTLILAVAIGSAAFAQSIVNSELNGIPVATAPVEKGSAPLIVVDTLFPPSFSMACAATHYYYTFDFTPPGDSGYVFGNNVYGATESAEKYYGTGTVSNILVRYGIVTGATGVTNAKVYSINPATKAPQTVLGTSANLATGSLALYPTFNNYAFTPAVPVAAAFACALVFPTTAGDTVAITSTQIGCSTPDSLCWTNLPTFGGWFSNLGYIGVNMDIDITPIADINIGLNEYAGSNGLTLFGAYPNPATTSSAIKYSIANAADVSIEIFDITGKIFEKITETKPAGTHEFKFNTLKLASGTYYYTINTGTAKMTSKFEVVK